MTADDELADESEKEEEERHTVEVESDAGGGGAWLNEVDDDDGAADNGMPHWSQQHSSRRGMMSDLR